jgi:hypothetical protein
MKPLAVIAALAAVAYLIARKTGLLSRDKVQDLTEQAKDLADQAGAVAKNAVETVADHASDALPNH